MDEGHRKRVLAPDAVGRSAHDVLRAHAVCRCLPVGDLGARHDTHPEAVLPGPPAEVDVVTEDGVDGPHARQGLPHLAAQEHARRAHGEDFG